MLKFKGRWGEACEVELADSLTFVAEANGYYSPPREWYTINGQAVEADVFQEIFEAARLYWSLKGDDGV